MNKYNNNYIIKPTRITNTNKESEATIMNDIIDYQSKEINNIFDSRNLNDNSSDKRKNICF